MTYIRKKNVHYLLVPHFTISLYNDRKITQINLNYQFINNNKLFKVTLQIYFKSRLGKLQKCYEYVNLELDLTEKFLFGRVLFFPFMFQDLRISVKNYILGNILD